MKLPLHLGGGVAAAILLGACGAAPLHLGELDEVERVRNAPSAAEIAQRAPLAYARGESARDEARRAHQTGDDIAATLEAERALAAYEEARAVARLARAVSLQADAEKALADAAASEQALDATRDKLERDRDALEKRVQVQRDHLLPAPSPATSAEREAARKLATRSVLAEAHLLCQAAHLIAADGPGLADAVTLVEAATKRLDGPGPAPIDDAAAARVACLGALTQARRGAPDGEVHADALLSELSSAGGWAPDRDERGVVVVLRDAFAGSDVAEGAAGKLAELGRVAAAHPTFALQVVVHDAIAPADKGARDTARVQSAVKALVAGGAQGARVDAELAGAQLPIADPADPKRRGRNERVEVVFVGR